MAQSKKTASDRKKKPLIKPSKPETETKTGGLDDKELDKVTGGGTRLSG